MTHHNSSQKNWKDYLPDHESWLEKLTVTSLGEAAPGYHYLVPIEQGNNGSKETKISALPDKLGQGVLDEAKKSGWQPGSGSVTVNHGGMTFHLVATSKLDTTTPQKGRQVGLDGARYLCKMNCQKLVLCPSKESLASDLCEGYLQGLYSLSSFKGKKEEPSETPSYPSELKILGGEDQVKNVTDVIAYCRACSLTRLIADAPPNWLDSEMFAHIASSVAKDLGVKCHIKGGKELEELGMGSFLSVAQGTTKDPKLIVLEIEGQDPSRWVALVGKGLTFDAGGISLKPSSGMGEMKYDLCGGAAVMGAACYLAHHKPPTNVVCVIGAVENMPGNQATRPGDIVTAMNGQTIEILNTDAEGRLVLADLLHYTVENYKPQFVINTATLTGAVLFALGSVGSALISNEQKFADYVLKVAHDQGEPLWQLPLWSEFDKEVKSDIADLKNIASPDVKAGTIMGGAFLKSFVGKTSWCHLDIAGTGWKCKAIGYPTTGASAFGVKTLTQACLNWEG